MQRYRQRKPTTQKETNGKENKNNNKKKEKKKRHGNWRECERISILSKPQTLNAA